MAFKIELAAAAEREITDAVEYIAQDSPAMAQKWLITLFAVIESRRPQKGTALYPALFASRDI